MDPLEYSPEDLEQLDEVPGTTARIVKSLIRKAAHLETELYHIQNQLQTALERVIELEKRPIPLKSFSHPTLESNDGF